MHKKIFTAVLLMLLISPVLAEHSLKIENVELNKYIILPGDISFGKITIKNYGTVAEDFFLEINIENGIIQRGLFPYYINPQETIERQFYYKVPESARGKTNFMITCKADYVSVSENKTLFVVEPEYSFDGSLKLLNGWLPKLYLKQAESGQLKLLIVNTGTLEDVYVLTSNQGVYVNNTRFSLKPQEYLELDVIVNSNEINPGVNEIKITVCSKGNNECKEFTGSVDLEKIEENSVNFTEPLTKTVQLLVSNDGNVKQDFDVQLHWDGISTISPKSFTLFPNEQRVINVNLTGVSSGVASLAVLANNKTVWQKQINFTLPNFAAEIADLNWIFYVLLGLSLFLGTTYLLRIRKRKIEYQYWK